MKAKNIFKLLFIIILIFCVFINFKVYQSSSLQSYLIYDYNNNKYNVPYQVFSEELDDNFPNLTSTALPIKVLKARYLIELDSLNEAKTLLYDARKANPYMMASEEMLANIYIKENNLDSAYFYAKDAFNKMPYVNLHRQTYFKVLRSIKDSVNVENELDKAFSILKNTRKSENHWYDYIYSKQFISKSSDDILPIINEFKQKFPGQDNQIIDELENRVLIGTRSYNYFSLFSSIGDDYFKKEDYIKSSEYYEIAIGFNPDNYLIHENLAISYDLSNKVEKALEYYDIVINKFMPNDGRVEFYKGLLLYRIGQENLGCEYLNKSSVKNYIGVNTKISALQTMQYLCFNN